MPSPPSVQGSDSIHPEAYGQVPKQPPALTLELADREAVSRELIALCEAELQRCNDRSRRARLHYECARLYEVPLGELDRALEHYQQAAGARNQHVPTIAGLRRVRLLREDFRGALKALSDEVELSESPEERAALLFERARIFEAPLKQREEARKSYQAALEQTPGDAATLRALSRAWRRDGNHEELCRVLDAQAGLAGDDPSLFAARLSERARETELFASEGQAACAYYERAVEQDAMASAALPQAVRLYAKAGQFAEVVALERRRVSLLSDPKLRAATLSTTAELLAEHLADSAGAVALLEQAAAEDPNDLAPLYRLAELYERAGDHDSRVRTLGRLEAACADDRQRLDLRLALADIHRTWRNDAASAIEWLNKARDLDPNNPHTADALAQLYREQKDDKSLAAMLSLREKVSDDIGLRAALHVELAELFEGKLGDVERAIEHHRAALSLQPEHPGAFRSLSRLLHQQHRFSELAELHERAVELAVDDADAISHLLHAALIHETLLSTPAAALGCLERVLERDGEHLGALRGAQRLAEATDNPVLAVAMIEREIALLDEDAHKIPLMLRAAEISERQLADEERALLGLEGVLSLDAENRPALAALARIHRHAGRYKELVQVLLREVPVLSDARARCQTLLCVARIVEGKLSDQQLAIEHYKNAYLEDPSCEEAALALERVLAFAGCFEDLASHLASRLSSLEVPGERVRVALELGRIREIQLAQDQNALLAYDSALDADPRSLPARLGRIRCLGRLGAFEDLLGELDQLAQETNDAAARLWSLLYAGELLEYELGRPKQAGERFEQVLSLVPNHRGALLALERLHAGEGALMDVLKQQVGAFTAMPEQLAALRELSRIADRDEAGAELRRSSALKILEQQPTDARALLELELEFLKTKDAQRLADIDARWVQRSQSSARRSAHRTRLADFLEPIDPMQALTHHRPALAEDAMNIGAARGISRLAQILGDSKLMQEAAEGEFSVVDSKERASTLLRRAAQFEQSTGDGEAAASILIRALEMNPDDAESAGALHAVLGQLGQHDKLISVLTTSARAAKKPDVRAGHLISAARLLASARGDLGAAISTLRRATQAEPDQAALLLELAELYIKNRQWGHAAESLEQALKGKPDADSATAARLRLAELYHEHLKRTQDAATLLRAVIQDAPQERRAQRRLLAIQIEASDKSAEDTAEVWVQHTSGRERAEALTTLGRLQRDAGKSTEAEKSLAQAVALSGVCGEGAHRDLERMFQKQEQAGKAADWNVYAEALSSFCQGEGSAEEKARTLLELSRVLTDRMKTPEPGYAALAAGLRINPGDFALQKELATRLVQAKLHQRALPELYKLLELKPTRVETWMDLTATFDALGKNAEAHLALGPLVALGGGSDLERATWGSRVPRSVLVAEGSVDSTVLQSAARIRLPEAVVALLAQLSNLAPKVMDGGPERYGLTQKDRVGPRGLHPGRVVLDHVARAFGVSEVDLYPAEGETAVSVVLTDPVGIVVPKSFDSLTEIQQVFCLARPLYSIAQKAQVAAALGPQNTVLLLAAAAAVVGVELVAPGFSAEQVAETGRRLAKAIPWLSKGRFEENARRYFAEQPPDIALALEEIDRAALRIALLASDDLSCLQLVQERGPALFGLERAELKWTMEDLLSFWVSPAAMGIRRMFGIC